jgi:hypothetical protein
MLARDMWGCANRLNFLFDIHSHPRLQSGASALGFAEGGDGFSVPSVVLDAASLESCERHVMCFTCA